MAGEVKKLRRELEVTRARCRQLVAVLSRKLQEKERELRESHDLRDRQLATVLRSLLTLESRLRKEQKVIRQQLKERDHVIEQQSKEIMLLRASDESKEESLESPEYKQENAYRDNPVLESVQQILLKDEEDLMTDVKPVKSDVKSVKNDIKCVKSDVGKSRVDVGVAWYETDSSLVVTDNADEVADMRIPEELVVKVGSLENCALPSPKEPSGAWCIKVIEAEEPAGHERLWVKDKVSPPTKAQHLEERACLQMAKRTLTIAYPKTAEEIEAKSITVLESSYQELVPVKMQHSPKKSSPQKPPALPPKPQRLLKPSELFQRTEEDLKSDKPPIQTKPRVHLQEIKRKQMNGHVPGNAKPQVTFALEERGDPVALMTSPNRVFPAKKSQTLPNGIARQKESPETHKVRPEPETSIRICSSVSSLIMGVGREGVTDLTAPTAAETDVPPVDPVQPEIMLQDNFEEFKLEECYVESVKEGDGRPQADGAEGVSHYGLLPPPAPPESQRTYETFLESTGLSQKSILTPSRMLSNHRSCLKPKDVKHRSKVKAAAVGPTVKYWTEPYL